VTTIANLRAALGRNTPAIIMTGDIRSETVAPIAAQGISVLRKPFLLDDLLQHIARVTSEPATAPAGTTTSVSC
jgi:CheY-like chemotaxis protein